MGFWNGIVNAAETVNQCFNPHYDPDHKTLKLVTNIVTEPGKTIDHLVAHYEGEKQECLEFYQDVGEFADSLKQGAQGFLNAAGNAVKFLGGPIVAVVDKVSDKVENLV